MLRESKVAHGFSTAWEVGTPNPHVLQESTLALYLLIFAKRNTVKEKPGTNENETVERMLNGRGLL